MSLLKIASAVQIRLEAMRLAAAPFVADVQRAPTATGYLTKLDLQLHAEPTYSDQYRRSAVSVLKRAADRLARSFTDAPATLDALGRVFREVPFHSFWERLEGLSNRGQLRAGVPVEGARLIGVLEAHYGRSVEELLADWSEPQDVRWAFHGGEREDRFGAYLADIAIGITVPTDWAPPPAFSYRHHYANGQQYLHALAGAAIELAEKADEALIGLPMDDMLEAARFFGAVELANDLNLEQVFTDVAAQGSDNFVHVGRELARGAKGTSKAPAFNELVFPQTEAPAANFAP